MANEGKKAALVLIPLVVVAVLLGPLATTVNGNTGDQTVTNETVTASNTSYVELQGYDIDDTSETVYWLNSSSGSYETVSEPADYEVNYTAGSIIANSTGKIGDGDSLKVTYTYAATSGMVTTIAGYIPLFAVLLILGFVANEISDMM